MHRQRFVILSKVWRACAPNAVEGPAVCVGQRPPSVEMRFSARATTPNASATKAGSSLSSASLVVGNGLAVVQILRWVERFYFDFARSVSFAIYSSRLAWHSGQRTKIMTVYFLTRESRPGVPRGQRAIIFGCLQPAGSRKALDQLVDECLQSDYATTFRHAPKPQHLRMETARSILYHFIEMDGLIGSEKVGQ